MGNAVMVYALAALHDLKRPERLELVEVVEGDVHDGDMGGQRDLDC